MAVNQSDCVNVVVYSVTSEHHFADGDISLKHCHFQHGRGLVVQSTTKGSIELTNCSFVTESNCVINITGAAVSTNHTSIK